MQATITIKKSRGVKKVIVIKKMIAHSIEFRALMNCLAAILPTFGPLFLVLLLV
jgi:hypothetical protein